MRRIHLRQYLSTLTHGGRLPERRWLGVLISIAVLGCGGSPDGARKEKVPPPRPRIVVGLARVEPPGRLVTLTPAEQGVIAAIYLAAGDHAGQGDTIVALENRVERSRYLQARSRYQAQAGRVAAVRAQYLSARATATNRDSTLRRVAELHDRNAATGQELDDVRLRDAQARQQVEEARGNLRAVRHEEMELRNEFEAAEALYGRRFIVAPSSGVVFSIDFSPGDLAGPETPVGAFGRVGPPIAVTEIDELFQARVCVGQCAYIRNRGVDDTIAPGTVAFAAPFLRRKSLFTEEAGDMEDRRVREVHIALEPGQGLMIGSRVEAVILVDTTDRSRP